jgi:hypothetical protein
MADIPVPGYQEFWTDTCNKLKSEYQQLIGQFPDADAQLKQLLKVIRDIQEMASNTPPSVGESEQWSSIVSTAEENRQNFCKALSGKTLFSALYVTYRVALHDLKAVLKASTPARQSKTPKSAVTQEDGYKEVRRHKRHSSNETAQTSKKAVPIVSAYELSTSKITLLDINNNLPGLDRLLKYKQRLRKMWQETRDPACKTAVNWVTKQIRRMTLKKAH